MGPPLLRVRSRNAQIVRAAEVNVEARHSCPERRERSGSVTGGTMTLLPGATVVLAGASLAGGVRVVNKGALSVGNPADEQTGSPATPLGATNQTKINRSDGNDHRNSCGGSRLRYGPFLDARPDANSLASNAEPQHSKSRHA
jgi:hypothetical protein